MFQAGQNYMATFQSAELMETEKGTPCLEMTWLVDGVAKKVKLYLSDKAWDTSEKKLRANGFNGNFEAPGFAGDVELKFKYETFQDRDGNDRTVEKWDFANWGGNSEPASRATVVSLAQRWKAATPVDAQKPTKPLARPAAAPVQAAPAPVPPAPRPEATRQIGQDDAWAAFCETNKALDGNSLNTRWFDMLKSVTGKIENLTPAEWAKVFEAAQIPF